MLTDKQISYVIIHAGIPDQLKIFLFGMTGKDVERISHKGIPYVEIDTDTTSDRQHLTARKNRRMVEHRTKPRIGLHHRRNGGRDEYFQICTQAIFRMPDSYGLPDMEILYENRKGKRNPTALGQQTNK